MRVTGNLAIILGGGRGSRLYPLTKERCKPAVPLGGKYRLIDVPISNCVNSGLRDIYIVSQFMSASLNQHIARAYLMDVFSSGFVSILAATQTGRGKGSEDWFQGTADAVRKCIAMMNPTRYKRVVILSGDQLYKMNYQDLLKTHLAKNGDISIAVLPVEREKVEDLGIMRIDGNGRIIEFVEKPHDPHVIDSLKVSESFAEKQGMEKTEKRWLANMGIYVFETQVLIDALADERMIDFGKDLIPASLSKYNTVAHLFDGYWEDIGTIKSFFEANIQLGSPDPPFDFFGGEAEKIFTKQRFLTASRFLGAHIGESVISDGCHIGAGAEIIKSVIGIRSRIGESTRVEESIVMGADSAERRGGLSGSDSAGLCKNVVIKRAILDKNVYIGEGAKIINARKMERHDGDGYYIRDGIVVIPKNAVIPPGTVI
ncbi:Glucose-1-phosphate adenylyltransferase [hydrothermal vent metagenome]|uniref:Glucose-1-phosphate adenylyltransferase n=1 Tax=hydrothermal vent metagenome TaxID=652676 RepID=A0A3B1DAS2_9ZZZZ